MPRTNSFTAEATDSESARALLCDQRGRVRIRRHGEPFKLRLDHHGVGRVGLDQVDLDVSLELDLAPASLLVFGQGITGSVSVQTQRGERRYARGDVYLAGQPDQWRTTRVRASAHALAVMTPDLISQEAETAPRRIPGPVRFTGYHPVSRQAAGMWRSAYGYVRDAVTTGPGTEGYPLLAASAARLLAAAALDVFPNDAPTA